MHWLPIQLLMDPLTTCNTVIVSKYNRIKGSQIKYFKMESSAPQILHLFWELQDEYVSSTTQHVNMYITKMYTNSLEGWLHKSNCRKSRRSVAIWLQSKCCSLYAQQFANKCSFFVLTYWAWNVVILYEKPTLSFKVIKTFPFFPETPCSDNEFTLCSTKY